MPTFKKIANLRQLMLSLQLDALIIPTSDSHQNEYLNAHWSFRAWLSGFTGSAGTLVITQHHAGLWTDSRYFLQAATQLHGSGIELHEMTSGKGLEYDVWLVEQLSKGAKVGYDGSLLSINQLDYIQRNFNAADLQLVFDISAIYGLWEARPPMPETPIFEHNLQFVGEDRTEKITAIQHYLTQQKVDGCLLSALDEIAWLFNLRGSDIPCNPLFFAYTYLTPQQVVLFTDKNKISIELQQQIKQQGIDIQDYEAIYTYLETIPESHSILIDPVTTSVKINQFLKAKKIHQESYIRHLKSKKNPTEIAHIKKTMVKDGVALVKMYRWLEQTLEERPITEVEVAQQLRYYRSQQDHYRGESFEAIVGYNANGAIVHYKPESSSCATIQREGILLVDSGGQYLDGTTDITRTIALGQPSAQQKRDFTLVLKGHIALLTACFPEGTNGIQLDAIARQPLWKHGLNYGHGTGHGVGYFSNVHESPPKIVPTTNGRGVTILKPGMVMSNEPGLYRKDEYGIRIENLMVCVEGETGNFGTFLQFEVLSLFPIAQQLIVPALLDETEIRWLNNYHRKVYEALSPFLEEEEQKWLKYQCQPLNFMAGL